MIPFITLLMLIVLMMINLNRDLRLVPSPLIGQPAPGFSLPTLNATGSGSGSVTSQDMHGQRWMMNVWASWCGACKQEHPILNALSRQPETYLVGLNYKDAELPAHNWLHSRGNPYRKIAFDAQGAVGLDWGVYGVPETFLIDQHGTVVYKLVGPVTQQIVDTIILPFFRGEDVS